MCLALQIWASPVDDLVASKPQFDLKKATQRFDAISLKISRNSLELVDLNQKITQLEALIEQSEDCVERAGKQIQETKQQIKQYFGDSTKGVKGADLLYLEAQNKKVVKRRAACRLLLIKSLEVLEAARERAIEYQKTLTFTKGKPLWTRSARFINDTKTLQWPKLSNSAQKTPFSWIIAGFFLLIFPVVGLSYYVARKLHSTSKPQKRSFYRIFGLMYFFLLGLIILPNVYKIFADQELTVIVAQCVKNTVLILAFLLFVTVFFLIRPVVDIFRWYGLNIRFSYQLLVAIGLLMIGQLLLSTLLKILGAPANTVYFFESILLFLALILVCYFGIRFYSTHRFFFSSWISRTILMEFFIGISCLLLFIDIIGYHPLAINSASIFFALLITGLLVMLGWRGIQKLFLLVHYSPQSRLYLGRHLGQRSNPPYYELIILKWLSIFLLCLSALYLFAVLVGEQAYVVEEWLEYFIQGGHFAGFHLVPLQWLIGLLVFSTLILTSHYLAARVSKRQQFDDEEEVQVAFASIITYAGLAIAILMGLFIAGFSFTSLTIIAGALSVGIGLGLQSIVNNFFSGLILLIEKPIKTGDRISVNGVEGFVKRVRVRSTQIVTPAKEDIIIPNSDLITHQVTNYMFSDSLWRIKCEVGVAYGSDVRLVEKTLMQVAVAHSEVEQTKKNQPRVLFQAFGDSALMFELWCLISDVNNKYRITSELNFAIEKAFREQDIVIAFPQQDVHLHWPDGKAPDQ